MRNRWIAGASLGLVLSAGLLFSFACGGDSNATTTPSPARTVAATATQTAATTGTHTTRASATGQAPTTTSTAIATIEALDPCSLVTVSQLGNAMGEQFNRKEQTSIECGWESNSYVVTLDVLRSLGQFDTAKQQQGGVKVDGLGDNAYWISVANELAVLVGADEIDVNVGRKDTGETQEDLAKQVASDAVDNIRKLVTPTP